MVNAETAISRVCCENNMHEKKKSASSTSATMVSCTSPPPSQALTNDWHGRPWINSGLCRCISDLLDDYGENQVETARMHKNNDHGNTTAYLKYNAKRLIHHTNPLGDQGLLQYGTYHFHPTRGPSLPPPFFTPNLPGATTIKYHGTRSSSGRFS